MFLSSTSSEAEETISARRLAQVVGFCTCSCRFDYCDGLLVYVVFHGRPSHHCNECRMLPFVSYYWSLLTALNLRWRCVYYCIEWLQHRIFPHDDLPRRQIRSCYFTERIIPRTQTKFGEQHFPLLIRLFGTLFLSPREMRCPLF